MIENVFTLEDEPMTPETPEEGGEGGGTEEGGETMPAGEPESLFEDETPESTEEAPEARLEDEEEEKKDEE